jgi:hypothetical protein
MITTPYSILRTTQLTNITLEVLVDIHSVLGTAGECLVVQLLTKGTKVVEGEQLGSPAQQLSASFAGPLTGTWYSACCEEWVLYLSQPSQLGGSR